MAGELTLHELVGTYIGSLGDTRSGNRTLPIWAIDLSLYHGKFRLWLENPMLLWSDYLADQVARGSISPPHRRSVVRSIPLRTPRWPNISAAKEYWLEMKLGLHRLLSPGPLNLVFFGDICKEDLELLNYALVPNLVLVHSSGVLDGDNRTKVESGRRGIVVDTAESFEDRFLGRPDDDPNVQKAFPLYYQEDTFRARRLGHSYFRGTLGRFLWKLQQGICPLCGTGSKYTFDEMEIDHVVPIDEGGNNSLLNIEMKCKSCNRKKGKYLAETQDYLTVLKKVTGVAHTNSPILRQLFSLQASDLQIPVRFGLFSS